MLKALSFLAFCVCAASAHAENRHIDKPPIADSAVCQQPLRGFPEAWSLCPVNPTPVEKDETNWQNPNCAYPNSHDEADLCIQREMSAYANETLTLGRWQFIFTILGFIALIYTLYLTRSSTNAAIVANEIASDTAKQELRAYVFPLNAVISIENNAFKVVVRIENFGQTPAYKFDHFCIFETTPYPRTIPYVGLEIDTGDTSCIPPGSHTGVVLEPSILPEKRMQEIESGNAMVWVWGEIGYEDAFGNRQSTKYRFMYNGTFAKAQNNGVMMSAREGNEAT